MNVLSEVFKAVKLGVIMFYNAELSAPWYSPAARMFAPYFSRTRSVIIFHLLTEGYGYANLMGG
jgi:hypothetical protein